jgi:hypothetical protein
MSTRQVPRRPDEFASGTMRTHSAKARAVEERILALQGGGAPGAYQAGVYEVLAA